MKKKNDPTLVTKHNGASEAFEFGKLRRCVANAMRSCGYDELYADALAKAIAIHVNDWPERLPPTTAYVFECVTVVLDETGLGDVRAALVRHRRQRAAKRDRIAVFDTRRPGRPQVAWSKARIAETLERRHRVKATVARILASELETRVLALNYNLISTSLIAELIRNELMAWGLSDDAVAVAPLAAGLESIPADPATKLD